MALQRIWKLAQNDTDYVKYAELFRKTRNDFLADRIRAVEKAHMEENEDIIDELIRLYTTTQTKLSSECGALNGVKLRMCSNCRVPLMKQSFTSKTVCDQQHPIDPYESFRHTIKQEKTKLQYPWKNLISATPVALKTSFIFFAI